MCGYKIPIYIHTSTRTFINGANGVNRAREKTHESHEIKVKVFVAIECCLIFIVMCWNALKTVIVLRTRQPFSIQWTRSGVHRLAGSRIMPSAVCWMANNNNHKVNANSHSGGPNDRCAL